MIMANKMTAEQLKQMCENAEALGFRSERLMLLDERLTEWSKNSAAPSIAVKVLRHGKTAFEGAYGIKGPGMVADSLTVDTIFPLCSITKPIVAVLICIMQEEGLVDINMPAALYLPEFTGDSKWSVRICNLLTHTSGIVDDDLQVFIPALTYEVKSRFTTK
jgi:CubicO group peptidase (beta-lactamase class C family)